MSKTIHIYKTDIFKISPLNVHAKTSDTFFKKLSHYLSKFLTWTFNLSGVFVLSATFTQKNNEGCEK